MSSSTHASDQEILGLKDMHLDPQHQTVSSDSLFHTTASALDLTAFSRSWHIPYFESRYSSRYASKVPVIFLEDTTEDVILSKLKEIKRASPSWLVADCLSEDIPLLSADVYPYIRDGKFRLFHVCQMLQDLDNGSSAILLGSDFGRDAFVARTPCTALSGETFELHGAKVPLNAAIHVATQVKHKDSLDGILKAEHKGRVTTIHIKTAKVQHHIPSLNHSALPRELLTAAPRLFDSPPDTLFLISLVPLETDQIQRISRKIMLNNTETKLSIVNWQGVPPSRGELFLLFEWLEQASTPSEHTFPFIFFLDNIIRDEQNDPQIIALSRMTGYWNELTRDQLSLLPVKAGHLIELWQRSHDLEYLTQVKGDLYDSRGNEMISSRINQDEVDQYYANRRKVLDDIRHQYAALRKKCGIPLEAERITNPRITLPAKGVNWDAPTLWFLRDFSLDEQRQIRKLLRQRDTHGDDDSCEFEFGGYIFADNGKTTHTVDELLEVFQYCDPMSPSFNPDFSSIRFNGYPDNFFAIDDLIFDEQNPQVHLASSHDFWHPANILGWTVGTVALDYTYTAWANLNVLNMGPDELMNGETRKLWLSDLKTYSQTPYDNEREFPDYESELWLAEQAST